MARDLIRIDTTGEALELGRSWGDFTLVPVGPNSFAWHGDSEPVPFAMSLEFGTPDARGFHELVIRYDDGYPEERFARLEEWFPSPELLARLTGTYRSAHLDYAWNLMIDESGGLVVRAPTMADLKVEPYQENEFLLRNEKFPGTPTHSWIRFHENAAGRVTHLTVWSPRLMHHRFDRLEVSQ